MLHGHSFDRYYGCVSLHNSSVRFLGLDNAYLQHILFLSYRAGADINIRSEYQIQELNTLSFTTHIGCLLQGCYQEVRFHSVL